MGVKLVPVFALFQAKSPFSRETRMYRTFPSFSNFKKVVPNEPHYPPTKGEITSGYGDDCNRESHRTENAPEAERVFFEFFHINLVYQLNLLHPSLLPLLGWEQVFYAVHLAILLCMGLLIRSFRF